MASFHVRSRSFPSQSHPKVSNIEDHLERLKASQAASTSSICANLASLKDLHEGINDMIQTPTVQVTLVCEQGKSWINELLEGSIRLVDLCGFSRDILQLTKESVQDLESSLRRKKVETATSDDVSDYLSSRKKINKMVKKCIKNLKPCKKNSAQLSPIGTMLKESEGLALSILKFVLTVLSSQKETSSENKIWSVKLSKMTKTKRVHSEMKQEIEAEDLCVLNIHKSLKNLDSKTLFKQIKASEMAPSGNRRVLGDFVQKFGEN